MRTSKISKLSRAARAVITSVRNGRQSIEGAMRKFSKKYRVNFHQLWIQVAYKA